MESGSQPVSDWAVTLSIGLVLTLLIGGFGTAGYFIATRKTGRPFLVFLLRYAAAFLSLVLLEAGCLWLIPPVHTGMRHLTTLVAGWLLALAGADSSISGSTLAMQSPSIAFDVDVACLGGILLWSYTALLFAEPTATRKQRFLGLAVGCATLIAFNLFRIAMSIYVEWSTGFSIHNYFYLINMLFVLCIWGTWLRTIRARQQPAVPDSA